MQNREQNFLNFSDSENDDENENDNSQEPENMEFSESENIFIPWKGYEACSEASTSPSNVPESWETCSEVSSSSEESSVSEWLSTRRYHTPKYHTRIEKEMRGARAGYEITGFPYMGFFDDYAEQFQEVYDSYRRGEEEGVRRLEKKRQKLKQEVPTDNNRSCHCSSTWHNIW